MGLLKRWGWAWLLAAAMPLPGNGTSEAGERGVIGLSLPSRREDRWRRDLGVMVQEARNRGFLLKHRMANNDQEEQNRQVEELLDEGIDVLMLTAHDTGAVAGLIGKVRERGVKVLVYDRIVNDCEYELYMGFDSVKVGVLQGEWITKKVPRGRYVVMSGAPTDDNAALFRSGVDQILKPFIERGDIKVVMDRAVTDWDPAVAERIVGEALSLDGGGIDAIVAPNDGTAGGAIAALAARGLAGKIPVTGHDGDAKAAERVVAGTQGMTVLKDTRLLGRESLRLAVRMARGASLEGVPGIRMHPNGKTSVPMVLIKPMLVDADNVQKELYDSGYLSTEQTAIVEVEDKLDANP